MNFIEIHIINNSVFMKLIFQNKLIKGENNVVSL